MRRGGHCRQGLEGHALGGSERQDSTEAANAKSGILWQYLVNGHDANVSKLNSRFDEIR